MKRPWTGTALAALILLSACGNMESSTMHPPSTAVLHLSTSGTGTQIYGIDVTVTLPAGVTVRNSNPPQVDADVLSASGVAVPNSLVAGVYSAAAGTAPAQVRILLANANGFGTGTFCTLTSDLAGVVWPATEQFIIASFSASDATGNAISGLNAGLTIDIR